MKKLLRILLVSGLFALAFLSTNTTLAILQNTFDTSTPAGDDDPRQADDRMREIKAAVQERMNDHDGTTDDGDHYWPLSSTNVSDVDTGQHRMVTLRQMSGNPSALTSYSTRTNLGWLYQKDVAGNGELFYEDEALNYVQMTKLGLLNLNSAYWNGTLAAGSSDTADTNSVALAGGGAAGVGRGGTVYLYGNEHATYPGQIRLVAGYSTETTKAIIDAATSKISNVVDPVAAQDAATKAYVDAKAPVYAGEQSYTFTGGLILKQGTSASLGAYATLDITFASAFNTFKSASITIIENGGAINEGIGCVGSASKLTLTNKMSTAHTVYWQAWGY